jgi:hypothetical protein
MADAPKVYRSKGSFAHSWSDGTVEAWMPNEEISTAFAGSAERRAYAEAVVAAGLVEEVPAGEAREPAGGRRGGRG